MAGVTGIVQHVPITPPGIGPCAPSCASWLATPVGLIVSPGSGITDNLADKAKRLGIPVWFDKGRA